MDSGRSACYVRRVLTPGMTLDHMDYSNVAAQAGVWEMAIKKMRVGMMPPQGAPQPDAATRGQFVTWLAESLDQAR